MNLNFHHFSLNTAYGMGIDSVLHHVTTGSFFFKCQTTSNLFISHSLGHVAHHFFSRIPHYHLEEATVAIRSALQKYPGAYKRTDSYKYFWFIIKYQW
jgi:fatty acid desaturase